MLKKVISIIIFMSIFLIINMGIVNAETEIKEDDKLELTLNFNNMNDTENIGYIEGVINFNETIFEELYLSDFELSDNLSDIQFEDNKFIIKYIPAVSDKEYLNINFKVKEDIQVGQEKIEITNFKIYNGESEKTLENIVYEFKLLENQSTIDFNDNTHEISQDINTENEDNTNIWMLILGLVFIVLGIIGIIVFLLIDKKTKRLILIIAIILIGSGIIILLIEQTGVRNSYDINNDGSVDELDSEILRDNLIKKDINIDLSDESKESQLNEIGETTNSDEQQTTNHSNGNNLDVNGDGEVNLEDLGNLEQELENQELQAFNTYFKTEKIYYQKNEKIAFEIGLENNANYGIKKLVVNGQEVEFKYNTYSELYYVEIDGYVNSGIQNIKIDEIMLGNGITYKLNQKMEIEVLKDAPSIENFKISNTEDKTKQVISFNFLNNDNTQINTSRVNVNTQTENIISQNINQGENNIELDLNYNTEYIVEISYEYNADTDSIENDIDNSTSILTTYLFRIKEDNQIEISENGIDFEEKIEIITLNNIVTLNKDYVLVDKIAKNEEFYLELSFEIIGDNRPSNIIVNEKTISLVEKEDSEIFNEENNSVTKTYYAKIDPILSSGEFSIKTTEILTNSGVAITVNNENIVEILKEKPIVTDVSSNIIGDEIQFGFNITDNDSTISHIALMIYDKTGSLVKEETLNITDTNKNINIESYLEGKYTYSFVSIYELENGVTENNKVLQSGEFIIAPKVRISAITLNKEYIEKTDSITATINVETNKIENIQGFVINNIIVDAVKNVDGTYISNINLVNNTSGQKDIIISKAIFDDKIEVNTNGVKKVEVLKSKPSITDINIIEDFSLEKITLEFNIIDEENAFISSELIVRDDSNTEILKETVIVGKNSIEIPVEIGKIYNVSISNKYKRDILGTMQNEEQLYNHDISLTAAYNFAFEDVKTVDILGNDKIYFLNNEKYRIQFTSSNNSAYIPSKMTINNNEYAINRVDQSTSYYVEMVTDDISGVKDLKITSVQLENNHNETIDKTLKIENLKVVPTANKFNYSNLDNGNIRIYIDILNNESITNYEVYVNDLDDNNIYSNNIIEPTTQYIDFTPTESELYEIIIKGTYDLDTNILTTTDNVHTSILVQEQIEVKREYIELKEANNIILYKDIDGETNQLEEVRISDLNNIDYFVQVTDSLGNIRYADVIDYYEEENTLYLVLDIEDSITYTDTKQEGTVIKYGGINEGIAKNLTFDALIKEIATNPSANITLTQNLDANDISVSAATYISTFKGTIDGNGYTISNLTKPLFNNLDNATIKNLVIDNANITNRAILSISTNNVVKITNVHIKNSNINNSGSTGGFISIANSGSNLAIEYSSISNTLIKGGKRTGGMVGQQYGDLSIMNSYIQAEIEATGDAIGGILGEIYGKITFDKIYADVVLQNTAANARGGFVGYGGYSNDTIKNSISLATGKDTNDGSKIFGNGYYTFENVYSLSDSNLISNNNSGITEISKDTINKDFILNTLGWDNTIWNIEGLINNGEMPKLNGIDIESEIKENSPVNDVEIPNFNYVSKLITYNSSLEIAYHNMNLLMPYMDSETIILNGNRINEEDKLNTSKISKIYPIDSLGNLVVGINNDTKSSISKIRVIFEDSAYVEYTLTYDKMLDSAVIYEINELGTKYNYTKLVFNNSNSIYSEVLEVAKTMDYYEDISSLTSETEDRLYNDYYNEYFVPQLEEKIGNIFETMEIYNITNDSENIANKIKNDLISKKELNEILYTANYFERYYNFDIGISEDFSDVIFWESDNYSDTETSAVNLVNETLGTTEENRLKNNTIKFFNEVLKNKYNNSDIKNVLEVYIKELDLNDNADQWFTDQFGGIIAERQMEAEELKDVKWTAWDNINARNHLLIPILSAPDEAQEDTYIISGPTQISIGSLNRYQIYLDGKIDEITENINKYADMTLSFYETSATFQPNAEHWLNQITNIQYDTRFNFPDDAPTPGTQTLGTTEDPMYKWINETIGMQMAANGSGAYANGTDVYWVVYSLLWSDFSFSVWTHETAHNQDGRYFYDGNWRRTGTGAEDHADYNIAQNMKEGHFTPNLRYDLPTTSDLTTNLKLDRITSQEDIKSFYDEMFDTLYLLDYLTGQAFLQLEPEEQAKLVTQVYYSYQDGPLLEEATDKTNIGVYQAVTTEQIEAMNLQNMQDLWDNRLVLKNAGTVGMNIYGTSSHYDILWYHPHNNYKVADGSIFKRTGYEMLGVGGVVNGRIAYHSGMSDNDLEAIRIATGDQTMTWEKYKMGRWTEVESNLGELDHFDEEIVIEMYKEALKTDAQNGNRNNTDELRSNLYNAIKHNTEDFDKGSSAYNQNYQYEVSTANELIIAVNSNEWGSYILTNDIDFTSSNIDLNTNSYITNTFVGVLDGNGHSITGLDAAIFNQVNYGHFKNINIENINVKESDIALISNKVQDSLIDNINIKNINVKLPIFGEVSGNNKELKETTYDIKKTDINNVNDLLNIENSSDPLAKKTEYNLTTNIDLSSLTGNTAVITGEFSGIINGNGFKISGVNKPIFENLTGTINNLNIESGNVTVYKTTYGLLGEQANNATVNNVNISNANIVGTAYDQVGTMFGYCNNTNIENVKIENINIVANNEVGGLVGKVQNSTIKQIEGKNNNITVKLYYGGGIIGRAHWTTIENICAQGTIMTTRTHTGGVVGVLRDYSTLKNVISNVEVLRPQNDDNRAENGGIVGGFENANASIINAIQLADVEADVYKIVSPSNSSYSKCINVYEIINKPGIQSVEGNLISEIELSLLNNEFYENTLGLDVNIWDFSTVSTLGHPTLK